jgi:hypothetical protein
MIASPVTMAHSLKIALANFLTFKKTQLIRRLGSKMLVFKARSQERFEQRLLKI